MSGADAVPRLVGLAHHAGRPAAKEAAEAAAHVLAARGIATRIIALADPTAAAVSVPDDPAFVDGLDLAVSFGGDGTFLRVAHLCRDMGVPVLGVNVGRLGFLAEVEVADLDAAMTVVASGGTTIRPRSTLEAEVLDAHGHRVGSGWALNEVAIEKSSRQRLVRLDVHIGTTRFAHVPADALIVATSTGSTAYALSAGGPIVSPRVDALLVVPVAPHSLFDRTVVVAPDEPVRVILPAGQDPGVVTVDGRTPIPLGPGGCVIVTGGGRPVRLATVGPADFYALVREKFGLR